VLLSLQVAASNVSNVIDILLNTVVLQLRFKSFVEHLIYAKYFSNCRNNAK
jgi:hypothetical protein